MESRDFVDFITLLPMEILEIILWQLLVDPLSNEDFTNCRLVCKNWNKRISNNSHLWQVACRKLGLNVKKDAVVDYKGIFLKMRKRFQKMKNGREVLCSEILTNPYFPVNKYCHHKGVTAARCERGVCILELEPELRVVSGVDVVNYGWVHCFDFDDSYLVVGTSKDYVITYKMPTMEKLRTKKIEKSRVENVTFNKHIDLLVTVSARNVTFWCLSSRTVHFTRTFCISISKMHLSPNPHLQNGCDYMLHCLGLYSIFSVPFNSQQITTGEMNPLFVGNMDSPYTLLGHYFRSPFFYLVRHQANAYISILCKYDPVSNSFEEIGRFSKCRGMNVVGVGNKYACLLQQEALNHPQRFIIYDLEAKSSVTSCDVPYLTYGEFTLQDACLVNGDFLDGFDGLNDKGVVFIGKHRNHTFVLKWRE